jgi:hypothetical protein
MECSHLMIVPFAFNVNPAGTVTPVKVTCPGLVPIVGFSTPSKVSLANIFDVVSPVVTATGVSSLAINGLFYHYSYASRITIPQVVLVLPLL